MKNLLCKNNIYSLCIMILTEWLTFDVGKSVHHHTIQIN